MDPYCNKLPTRKSEDSKRGFQNTIFLNVAVFDSYDVCVRILMEHFLLVYGYVVRRSKIPLLNVQLYGSTERNESVELFLEENR